jgi:hypothetical protein
MWNGRREVDSRGDFGFSPEIFIQVFRELFSGASIFFSAEKN